MRLKNIITNKIEELKNLKSEYNEIQKNINELKDEEIKLEKLKELQETDWTYDKEIDITNNNIYILKSKFFYQKQGQRSVEISEKINLTKNEITKTLIDAINAPSFFKSAEIKKKLEVVYTKTTPNI